MFDEYAKRLLKQIPYGKDNAISLSELSQKHEYNNNELYVRSLINELVFDGVLIIPLNNGDGYYRPTKEDYNDVWKYFSHITNPVLREAIKKSVCDYINTNFEEA